MNAKQTQLTWKVVGGESHGAYLMKLIADHGFKSEVFAGRIGSGTKIHRLHALCRHIDANTIEIAQVGSGCGSAKWQSGLNVFVNDDLASVNCSRCC